MNIITLTTAKGAIHADGHRAASLAIPLHFAGGQPAAFGAPQARTSDYETGGFVGNVARGGSCNVKEYRLIPHCNGTHTECVGHVTRQPVNVTDIVTGSLEPALLLSVALLRSEDCAEDTDPAPQPGDSLITARSIEAAWRKLPWPGVDVSALALRTLPNRSNKKTQCYAGSVPPYLTRQAVQLLVDRSIRHVLLDVPSLDRTDDRGLLTGHRLFWGLPAGSTDASRAARPHATVTEFMFADNDILDGRYLLDLQLAPFIADAVPSRPILYPVTDSP